MRSNQYAGAPFTLDIVIPAPVDHIREQVFDVLLGYYAEHRRPTSIKTLAKTTHRSTRIVIEAVQELMTEGLDQRLGRQGKQGVVPLITR